MTAQANAIRTAAFHGLDESAALDLLARTFPDFMDCTGDADACRCSWHVWRRQNTLEAVNEAGRLADAEWLRRQIAETRLLIAELQRQGKPATVIQAQESWLADYEAELETLENAG